jgi:hypothetical protein
VGRAVVDAPQRADDAAGVDVDERAGEAGRPDEPGREPAGLAGVQEHERLAVTAGCAQPGHGSHLLGVQRVGILQQQHLHATAVGLAVADEVE